MELDNLRKLIIQTLEDMKALDIKELDVRGKSSITDYMIIASGTSNRHVKSIAESVAFKTKHAGEAPLSVSGLAEADWALVDLNGVIVHVMQSKVRDFYQLERLWDVNHPEQMLEQSNHNPE